VVRIPRRGQSSKSGSWQRAETTRDIPEQAIQAPPVPDGAGLPVTSLSWDPPT